MTRVGTRPTSLEAMFPLLSVTDLSAETCLAAALAVCDRARDAAEARDLLEMCGLLGVRP